MALGERLRLFLLHCIKMFFGRFIGRRMRQPMPRKPRDPNSRLPDPVIQHLCRSDRSVVILDCKGTPKLFRTVRVEAERAGRTFSWFIDSNH